jgi:ribosome-binding protein aMBF1 (putative translation factor)
MAAYDIFCGTRGKLVMSCEICGKTAEGEYDFRDFEDYKAPDEWHNLDICDNPHCADIRKKQNIEREQENQLETARPSHRGEDAIRELLIPRLDEIYQEYRKVRLPDGREPLCLYALRKLVKDGAVYRPEIKARG